MLSFMKVIVGAWGFTALRVNYCIGGLAGRNVHAEPLAVAMDSRAIPKDCMANAIGFTPNPWSQWPGQ
jgi:hypothetical protein